KLDEQITKRLHFQGKGGIENAQHYRSGDSHKDLKSNIISSPRFIGKKRLAGFCSQDCPLDGAASNYPKVSLIAGTVRFLLRIQFREYQAAKYNYFQQVCYRRIHRMAERCPDMIHSRPDLDPRLCSAIIDGRRGECNVARTIRTLSTCSISACIRPGRSSVRNRTAERRDRCACPRSGSSCVRLEPKKGSLPLPSDLDSDRQVWLAVHNRADRRLPRTIAARKAPERAHKQSPFPGRNGHLRLQPTN